LPAFWCWLPSAGELMRDVAAGRASLWVLYEPVPGTFFSVVAVAIIGLDGGAIAIRAATPGFLERWFAFASVAAYAEAHRTGCLRVIGEIRPEDAQRAHDMAVRRGVFQPPLHGLEQYVGRA
jgi:hypothetical protein